MSARALRDCLLLIIITLLSIGCITVYSATGILAVEAYGQSLHMVAHHLASISLGLCIGLACLALPHALLRRLAKGLILASLLLLALVLAIGPEIGGAHRWFRIGRLSIQPSEFAQIALVLYLSDFLARKRAVVESLWEGFLPPMLVTGLMAVLVLLQPDLGTAIVMGAVAVLMLAIARSRWRYLGIFIALCAVALTALIGAEEYRRRRILAFLNPWQDPQGSGFQILQSYLALAGGGIFGLGPGASMQKLFYLPGAHTDFVFAIIGEELGLIGTTAVLGLFALFVSLGMRMAQMAEDPFHKYLIAGCVGLIGLEAVVHMAVVTGLLPTKGLPLPLVSYGGTSMVSNLLACALIIRASRQGRCEIQGVECRVS